MRSAVSVTLKKLTVIKTASSEKVLVFKMKTHILKWIYGYAFIDYELRTN